MLSQITLKDVGKEYIYLMLDEVDTFGKINNLPKNFETARARKISISTTTNNLNKLKNIYKEDFYTILNAIDTQMLMETILKSDIDYFTDITGLDDEYIKNEIGRDQLLIYEKGLKQIIANKYYYFENERWRTNN